MIGSVMALLYGMRPLRRNPTAGPAAPQVSQRSVIAGIKSQGSIGRSSGSPSTLCILGGVTRMDELLAGATYPFRAVILLRRTPGLWRYVFIPVAVNLGVGVVLYAGLLFAGFRAIDAIVAGLPEWAAVLRVLLRVLLVIGLLIATGFVLVRFGVVLGSPWYGTL
ncbi:MAG: EI24 domain-containing protein, partial [Chloroflexota bacterium]